MIELTDEQRLELMQAVPRVVDPATRKQYVLIAEDAYERFKSLLALDEYDPDGGAALMNEVMAEDDANDPLLAGYQNYRKPL